MLYCAFAYMRLHEKPGLQSLKTISTFCLCKGHPIVLHAKRPVVTLTYRAERWQSKNLISVANPFPEEFKGRASRRADVIARRKSPGTNFVCAVNWIMCHARTCDLRPAARSRDGTHLHDTPRRSGRRKLASHKPLIAAASWQSKTDCKKREPKTREMK